MSFVGIVTESKKEVEIKQLLKNYFDTINQKHTIIVINEKSIQNIKNVKFEILLIDAVTLTKPMLLQNIILNAKMIIVNSDFEVNLKCIKNLKLRVITYGLNSKSTITVSSVNEETILISLQRSVKTLKDNIIEPQEIKISSKTTHNNLYISMILAIFFIIFDKI